MHDQPSPEEEPTEEPVDWTLWPPSPRVQIILIAAAFGLINVILLVVWAVLLLTRTG